jgi:hypothetical protein
VNLGVPGTGTESLPGLFDRLHSEHPGRLVVYVGTDAFWFGHRWRTRAWFDVSYLRDLKYLLSGQTLRQSLDVLRRAPGALLHPDALRAVEVDRQGRTCVVDRGNSVFRGGSNAWAPDGELYFQYELAHAGEVPHKASLVTIYHPYYAGTALDGGHLEALEDALAKIDVGDENVRLRVIDRGVGAITETNVMLAAASDAVVIGFNVRPQGKATEVADREGVDIRYYSVIYQAIDEIEAALKGMLKPEFEEVQLGTAEIREVFRSSRVGNIAGCLVTSGTIRRNSKARLLRDGAVVADNLDIASLRREKDDVTEVRDGFECGLTLGGYNDIKIGDVVETFEMREVPRG